VAGGEVVGVVVGGVGGAVGGVVTGGAVGGVVAGGAVAGVLELDEGFGLIVLGVEAECGVDDVVVCGTVEAVEGAAPAGFTMTTTDHAPHLSVMFPFT